ncbi:MAG: energy transducer TonB [Mucinivorans sp.]
MELKKSPQADLNNKRSIFILTGVAVAMLATCLVFSWSQKEKIIEVAVQEAVAVETEMVEITVQEDKRPPAPIKTQAVTISDMLNIVKNDTKLKQDLSMLDIDMTQDLAVSNTKYGGTYTGPAEATVAEDTPVVFAEEMPKYDGKDGQTEFSRYCQTNLRYPPIALDNGVQGRVTISFVVEKDGKVTHVEIVRGVDRELDNAAIKIVQEAPNKWTPAKNSGRPVRLKIVMPIIFKLEQ